MVERSAVGVVVLTTNWFNSKNSKSNRKVGGSCPPRGASLSSDNIPIKNTMNHPFDIRSQAIAEFCEAMVSFLDLYPNHTSYMHEKEAERNLAADKVRQLKASLNQKEIMVIDKLWQCNVSRSDWKTSVEEFSN